MEALVIIIILFFMGKYFFNKTWVGLLIGGVLKSIYYIAQFFIPSLDTILRWQGGATSGVHGTARFAKKRERNKLLSPKHKDGIPLGHDNNKLSLDACTKHIMLVGASGVGKTTKFLYRILLSSWINLRASYLVTDVSGQGFHDLSGYLEKKGFQVIRINLMNSGFSHQYNPVSFCQTSSDYDKLSELLVSSANNDERGGKFWQDSAKMIISTLLKILARYPDKTCRNLHNVRHLLNKLSIDPASLNHFVSRYATDELLDDFLAFMSQKEELLCDVLSTAKVSLKSLAEPMLREISAGNQIDFQALRERPTVLFVSYNVEDIEYLRFFLSIFWTQALNSFTKIDLNNEDILPIFCLLDEFSNLSRLPGFEFSIRILRKYMVSLFIMIQELDGLHLYGKARSSIIGNCKTKLFSGGLQLNDVEYVSRMLGNSTVRYESPNAQHLPFDQRIRDVKEAQRPLMTPDEVRQIPESKCLIFHGAQRPSLIDLVPYYEDKELLKRTELPQADLDYSQDRTAVKYLNLDEGNPNAA